MVRDRVPYANKRPRIIDLSLQDSLTSRSVLLCVLVDVNRLFYVVNEFVRDDAVELLLFGRHGPNEPMCRFVRGFYTGFLKRYLGKKEKQIVPDFAQHILSRIS
jgi:hypothetical protein